MDKLQDPNESIINEKLLEQNYLKRLSLNNNKNKILLDPLGNDHALTIYISL